MSTREEYVIQFFKGEPYKKRTIIIAVAIKKKSKDIYITKVIVSRKSPSPNFRLSTSELSTHQLHLEALDCHNIIVKKDYAVWFEETGFKKKTLDKIHTLSNKV